MNNDLLYQIALCEVPSIGDVHAKNLIQIFGEAAAIFKTSKRQLELIEGLGSIRAGYIKSFKDFSGCENEIRFIEKHAIQPLFITSESYPKKLLHCYDCPAMLYFKGNITFNNQKIVSIVGTRNHSIYGKDICEKLIEELAQQNILVVSGLAYGIDTIAHQSALKQQLNTVAVLAHGLDRIYPAQNKNIAKQIIGSGGLLTEFKSGSNPDKQNFPKRNRITAGICDALVVVESGLKGGSLITAELANNYNKDVFAFPGRTNDIKSEGCNLLIKKNKAALITNANDLIEMMNWNKEKQKPAATQTSLFNDLTPAEKKIVSLLADSQTVQIDDLYYKSGLNSSELAGALLGLEMNGLIHSLPGKIFRLA